MRQNFSNANLTFHRVTLADIPILIQLYAEMDGNPPLPSATAEDIFHQIQHYPNYYIYIAKLDDLAVGTFSLLMAPTLMHSGYHQFSLLDAVTVRPDYRNQGLGKAMIQEALKLSQQAGCYKLMLSSNLNRDRAHHFYESLGFEQHGWSFSLKIPSQSGLT